MLYLAYIPLLSTAGLAMTKMLKTILNLTLNNSSLFIIDIISLSLWFGNSYIIYRKNEKEEYALTVKYHDIYVEKEWFADDIEKCLIESKSILNNRISSNLL